MRMISTWLALAALLVCSGCDGSPMSEARRDHLLAGDHGWIDLTMAAPTQAPDFDPAKVCFLNLLVNGELMLEESTKLAATQTNQELVGYRFVAPAGKLQTELVFNGCVGKAYSVKLDLALEKDHLAKLQFDGKALALQESSPYEPTSLEWVRAEITKLQAHDSASSEALSTLTKLALASLFFNFATLLYIVLKPRRG